MPIRDIKAKMAHHIAAVTPGLVQLLLPGYLDSRFAPQLLRFAWKARNACPGFFAKLNAES
jgi:hypothetical protein